MLCFWISNICYQVKIYVWYDDAVMFYVLAGSSVVMVRLVSVGLEFNSWL